jgi:hypothetical protein
MMKSKALAVRLIVEMPENRAKVRQVPGHPPITMVPSQELKKGEKYETHLDLDLDSLRRWLWWWFCQQD